MKLHTSLIVLCLIGTSAAWSSEDLEIFDLVEEINENFYKLMGVEQDATPSEIKRAFRSLSLVLHPDKNPSPNADIQFRNLVSAYEVLKDANKREKYNDVLKNGLPNWKSALYYYRRVRKMGLAEMSAILFGILTVCQYLIAWAAYAEKCFINATVVGPKIKKSMKKSKSTNIADSEISVTIPKPSIFNTLPFQIPKAIWNIPKAIKNVVNVVSEMREQEKELAREKELKEEQIRLLEEKQIRDREARKEGVKKRKQIFSAKEKTDAELEGYSTLKVQEDLLESCMKPVIQSKGVLSGGFWTDEDLVELVRLVKKYPSGTVSRWEVIGNQMNRSVNEVTFMAAKLKENGYRVPGHTDSVAENILQAEKKKEKTKGTPSTNWTQEQQQALESSLIQCGSSGGSRDWEKIASLVPGKSKDECIARFKYLASSLKSKRAKNNKTDDAKIKEQEEKTIEDDDNDSMKGQISEDELPQIDQQHSQVSFDEEEPKQVVQAGGKKRNKRKEKKKQMDWSNSEDDE